ncbi:MAG: RIP metalloprotease RseP [Armatimonadota bacterium]|nr:RIP metalloprotease RseP [Armatimonadota bacterium]MCX7778319.1 RIP metalloprotease RseP [Armatimonadota bacterium]MDW8025671.1 RIP metalloprotease RseP [Armatimonadota bacterium]
MDSLLPLLKSFLIPILVLGFVVLVHEAAHFFAALKVRMRVIEFSIFLGPVIWTRLIGGIRYSIRAIPFGGYVRIFGMELDEPSVLASPEAFHNRPVKHRMVVLLSGSLANLITAFALLFIYGMAMSGLRSTNVVARVATNMPAAKAGIKPGDRIVGVNGLSIKLTDEWLRLAKGIGGKRSSNVRFRVLRGGKEIECMAKALRHSDVLLSINGIGRNDVDILIGAISESPAKRITFTVLREGKPITLSVVPTAVEEVEIKEVERKGGREGAQAISETKVVKRKRGIIGVEFLQVPSDKPVPLMKRILDGAVIAAGECIRITYGIAMLFARLAELHHAVGGPIRIFWELKEQAWMSFFLQLRLIGMLSYIVGLLNLIIPILPLDGGRLALLFAEALSGQRINPKWELNMTLIGIAFLLGLTLLISARDIGYILRRITGAW